MTYIDVLCFLLEPQGRTAYLDEDGRPREDIAYEPWVISSLLSLIHFGGFVP